jgi:polyisoprenoid-binding protein YceI
MGIFQNNAGGAWDNAKKSFEKGVMINGKMEYKGSEPHKASVTGDTVGDPFKDTSGPSMNILIKLMSIVSLVIAPHIHVGGGTVHADHSATTVVVDDTNYDVNGTFQIAHKNSTMLWEGQKVGGAHSGNISLAEGQVSFYNGKLVALDLEIDMRSITCTDIKDAEDNQKLVGHLKSDDFFGVEEYANASLQSIKIIETVPNTYNVEGELTMKGITAPVSFPVTVEVENGKMIANATVVINRTKYGIRYKSKTFDNSLMDKFIYDEFTVKATVKAKVN